MENLSPGVLLKLLEQETSDEPSLVQIRSIVPIYEDKNSNDLFSKHGFYLKVSDSSHAMYVSLPREQEDMVLCDQLQLGQLVFVDKIEPSKDRTVPVVRGIRPVPGRHVCVGDPEEIVFSVEDFEKKSKDVFFFGSPLSGLGKDRRVSLPLFSRQKTVKRRSWVDDVAVSSSSFLGSKVRLKSVSQRKTSSSLSASTKLANKFEKLVNGNSSSVTKKTFKPLSEISNDNSMKNREDEKSSVVNDKDLGESKTILSHLLPRNLIKLGKEVEKRRDLALLASVEALQEASVSERLLKCLSEFSNLKSSNLKEKHPSLANIFFQLQQDLAQTSLILNSLTSTDQNSLRCSKISPPKLFTERYKAARSWINAALASDLDPLFAPSSPITEASNKTKNRHSKGSYYSLENWIKDRAFSASLELSKSLCKESKMWFLGYAEKYLDELSKSDKSNSLECSDSEVAEMMCRVTEFSDWLDSNDVAIFDESENSELIVEACERVRKKIYGVLLKMAERTALAWGHMKNVVEEVQQQ